jgi:hypothetical protein
MMSGEWRVVVEVSEWEWWSVMVIVKVVVEVASIVKGGEVQPEVVVETNNQKTTIKTQDKYRIDERYKIPKDFLKKKKEEETCSDQPIYLCLIAPTPKDPSTYRTKSKSKPKSQTLKSTHVRKTHLQKRKIATVLDFFLLLATWRSLRENLLFFVGELVSRKTSSKVK